MPARRSIRTTYYTIILALTIVFWTSSCCITRWVMRVLEHCTHEQGAKLPRVWYIMQSMSFDIENHQATSLSLHYISRSTLHFSPSPTPDLQLNQHEVAPGFRSLRGLRPWLHSFSRHDLWNSPSRRNSKFIELYLKRLPSDSSRSKLRASPMVEMVAPRAQ